MGSGPLERPSVVSQPTQIILDDNSSPKEKICGKVEQRIADIAEEVRTLHICCNRFLPVNRLGPDILSRVFRVLQQALLSESEQPKASRSMSGSIRFSSRLGWLQVMGVCRYWRAVAIDCPMLWGELTFHTPALAQLMLHRSRDAPLTVIASTKSEDCSVWQSQFWNKQGWRDVLRSALSHASQLRSVEMEASKESAQRKHLPKVLSALSGSTTSLLERLVILGHGQCVELPEDFISGGAPILKHLHLKGCSVPARILALSAHLTHLRIDRSGIGLRRQDAPSPNAFFDSLGSLHHLQTLDLANFLPTEATFSSASLSFPELESLKLEDSTSTITSFICNILIPASATVHVVFNDYKKDKKDRFKSLATPLSFDTFLLALSNSWRDDAEDDPRTGEGVIELRLVGFAPDSKCRMEFWFAAYDTPADLTIDFLTDKIGVNSILSIADKRLDLSTVMDLTVRGCESFADKEIWRTLGTLLYRMENLTLAKSPLTPFLDALLDDEATVGALNPKDILYSRADIDVWYYSRQDDEHYPDTFNSPEDEEEGEGSLDIVGNDELEALPNGASFVHFTYFPALWFLELRADFGFREEAFLEVGKLIRLVEQRASIKHDIMEILLEDCWNFTDGHFTSIRDSLPLLEIDWDGDQNLYTDSDTEDEEEDAHEESDDKLDTEYRSWLEYNREVWASGEGRLALYSL